MNTYIQTYQRYNRSHTKNRVYCEGTREPKKYIKSGVVSNDDTLVTFFVCPSDCLSVRSVGFM